MSTSAKQPSPLRGTVGERALRVGVIGAGAAGLVTARELLAAGHEVVVFEASGCLGGQWSPLPTPRARSAEAGASAPSSAVYDELRTNLPRALMAFRDFPFTDAGNEKHSHPGNEGPFGLPHHSAVRAYLERFADHFDLRRQVRLGEEVLEVRPPKGKQPSQARDPTSSFVVRSAALAPLTERAEQARAQQERLAQQGQADLLHGDRQFEYATQLSQLLNQSPWPSWFEPLYRAVAEARKRFPADYRDRFPTIAANHFPELARVSPG